MSPNGAASILESRGQSFNLTAIFKIVANELLILNEM